MLKNISTGTRESQYNSDSETRVTILLTISASRIHGLFEKVHFNMSTLHTSVLDFFGNQNKDLTPDSLHNSQTMLIDVKPSLFLNILFAVLGGLMGTLSTASTTYPAALVRRAAAARALETTTTRNEDSKHDDEEEPPVVVSKRMWKLAIFGNLLFALLTFICSVLATWFGPVTIYTPVNMASMLLSTMVMFGYILKTEEKPTKDKRIGNCE